MARQFVRASSQDALLPDIFPSITGVNYTCLSRFRLVSTPTTNNGILMLFHSVTANSFPLSLVVSSTGGGRLNALARTPGPQTSQSTHQTVVTQNVWHTAGFRRIGNLVDVFYDGVIGNAPSQGTLGAVTTDASTIGSQNGANYFDGDLADIAVWDVNLTQEEIDAYNAGVSPTLIRPDKLVAYYPLWGTTQEADISGTGSVGTLRNAPAVALTSPAVMPYKKRSVYNQITFKKRKEIEHIYRERQAAIDATSTTWVTAVKIDKASITPLSRFWLFAKSAISTDNVSNRTKVRVLNDGVEVLGSLSEQLIRTANFVDGDDYQFSKVFDFTETPGDIELQIANSAASTTRAQNSSMFMLRLDKDFKAEEDYWYRENQVLTAPTTSFGNPTAFVNQIPHPVSLLGTGEELMAVGCITHESNTTLDDLRKIQTILTVNASASSRQILNRDASEEQVTVMTGKITADAVINTFSLLRTAVNNAGSENFHKWSSLFVIRKNLFDQAIFTNAFGSVINPSTAETLHTDFSLTPNQVGSFVGIATAGVGYEAGSTAGQRNGQMLWKLNGARVPASDNLVWGCDAESVNEDNPIVALGYFPNLPTSLQTIELYTQGNQSGQVNFNSLSGFVFSLLPARHFKVSGIVKENTTPVSRTVRAFLSSTGELLGETTSRASDGFYEIDGLPGGNVSVVAYDDAGGASYNAQIFDKVVPVNI